VFSPASPCGSVGNSVLEEVNTQYLKELQAKKDNYFKKPFQINVIFFLCTRQL
jgi:hypothetical protein